MKTKIAIGIFAILACAAFVGIVGDVDAEGTEGGDVPATPEVKTSATIVYHIGTTVVSDPITVAGDTAKVTTTLKTLEVLGYALPAGSTFHGWYVSETPLAEGVAPSATYSAGSTFSVDKDKTAHLCAYITADTYTVTFEYADGSAIAMAGLDKLAYGAEIDLPVKASAASAGHVVEFMKADGTAFAGWALKGTTEIVIPADATKTTVTGNAAYVAVYAHNPVMTFVVDGTTTYTHTVYGIVLPNIPVKEGFDFIGWSDGTVTVKADELEAYVAAVGADTTLTAVWEPIVYTVHFYAGETEVLPAQSVRHGELVTEPKTIPVKEGFDFVRWDYDFTKPVTSDLTIEAVFEETPAPAPTGLDDPTTQILAILVGTMAVALIAIGLWKREAIRAGLLKRLDKDGKGDKGNGGDGSA